MIKTVLRQQVLSHTSYFSSIYLSKVEESCPRLLHFGALQGTH